MVTPNKDLKTSNIKLSIQVSLNGLSFCALDPTEKKILFFKDISFKKKLNPFDVLQEVEKVYQNEEFLKQGHFEVKVLFSNELYSLVPEKYFQEENAADFLKFNTRILETDYVAHDILNSHEVVNVYVPYTNINNFFFERYGEFEYRHCVSILINSFLDEGAGETEDVQVYVNYHTESFDLIVLKDQKLLLVNTFATQTPEDFIYYILFTAEQLELDPESMSLILLGRISQESDYYKFAYRYVRRIRFLDASFGYSYTAQESVPKASVYYTLFKALQ